MQTRTPWHPSPLCRIAITFAQFMIVGLFVMSLTGCGADGGSSPIISSATTPTTEEDPESSADPTESETSDVDRLADLPFPNEEDGMEDLIDSAPPLPTGSTAQLTWDVPTNHDITNYYVYYGKQSSGEPGSCAYEGSQSVEAPPATITGLEPNTVYFFAISAFGESESPCSSELLVVTPPAKS